MSSKRQNKKALYQTVFTSEHGEKVLADLVRGFYSKYTFNESHANMAYTEGRRSVIQHILDMLEDK